MAYFVSLMCSVNDSNIITLAMIMMTYVLSIFAVAEHLLAQHNAVKMLHGRIRIILDYIKAVEAGMHWATCHA